MSDLSELKKGEKVHWPRVSDCAMAEVVQAAEPGAQGEKGLPEILIPGEARLRSAYVHLPEGCDRPVSYGRAHKDA